jgi:glycerate kinase
LGVAALCREAGVPCVALAGAIEDVDGLMGNEGLTAAFSICNRPMTLEDSMARAAKLLSDAAANLLRAAKSCNA